MTATDVSSAGWQACWIVVALLLSGCVAHRALPWPENGGAVELAQVPFFAQSENHCGPAALASLLSASGVEQATPDELAQQVFIPGRQGALQVEMIAAARQFDRIPLKLDTPTKQLFEAISSGYPVLILQNLALESWPRWHYAVVVGFDSGTRHWILRSGTKRRLKISEKRLVSTWQHSNYWAVILARPDSPPGFVSSESWLAAVYPFERPDSPPATARRAYVAATQQWPHSAEAWIALANAHYASGQARSAIFALRKARGLDAVSATAANNLAYILAEQGCVSQARTALAGITNVPKKFAAELASTRAYIEQQSASDFVRKGEVDCIGL